MSEFRDAITWRGPDQPTFVAYGLWERNLADHVLLDLKKELEAAGPGVTVSTFVATDDDWPCEVGVFDVEASRWPDQLESFCEELLSTLCRYQARLAWMMFDGVFNDVSDIFSIEWATQVYAIRGNCGVDDLDYAVVDTERHSAQWKQIVLNHRHRVLVWYPRLQKT